MNFTLSISKNNVSSARNFHTYRTYSLVFPLIGFNLTQYMRYFLLCFTLLSFTFNSFAQLMWANSMGSGSSDIGRSIAVDAAGNVYTTGSFNGTVDFDPGAGTTNLTSAGATDIFIQKLNAAGNLVWVKSMGGATGNDVGASIAVDAVGDVYITGTFIGTVDLDPNGGTVFLTSSGGNADIFIQKLNAAGNLVAVKQIGGTGLEISERILVDGAGNIYTVGYFRGTADFDPNGGTTNLTSAGSTFDDIFIQKLNAAGNLVWAKNMGGTSADWGVSIAVDASGNVYTTGFFAGTADFDPGASVVNLASTGGQDIFVSKLDAAGNFVWAKRMGNAEDDRGAGIALDAAGDVYITGRFRLTVDFDPNAGATNLTSAGSTDIFVQKLSAAGNFVWAKSMGGTGFDQPIGGLALDNLANIYVTGWFANTADFDPGAATFNLTATGIDIFLVQLDNAGNFVLAKSMGGTGSDFTYGIAVDGVCNIYITGQFAATVDFDPGAGTTNLASNGSIDVFVAKYSCIALPITLLKFEATPENNSLVRLTWTTAAEINNDFFTLERSIDAINFESFKTRKGAGNSNNIINYVDYDQNPYRGISYYRLKQTDFDGTFSYSDVRAVSLDEIDVTNLYPNPAEGQITLQVSSSTDDELDIQLINGIGQLVFNNQVAINKGINKITINTSTLNKGIYTVHIVTKKGMFTKKEFVK